MFKLTGNHLFLSLGGTVFTIVLLTQMHILAFSSLLIVISGHTLCIVMSYVNHVGSRDYRERLLLKKEKQGFYYKQGVVVHFTLALFETDTLDTTCISNNFFARICIRMAYKGWCVRGRRLNTRKSPNQRLVWWKSFFLQGCLRGCFSWLTAPWTGSRCLLSMEIMEDPLVID